MVREAESKVGREDGLVDVGMSTGVGIELELDIIAELELMRTKWWTVSKTFAMV